MSTVRCDVNHYVGASRIVTRENAWRPRRPVGHGDPVPTHSASVPRPRFLWKQHCCLPLTTTARTADLLRYDTGAGAFTSLNVGDLVAEMNAVGMVVDGSHCSRRTGLDLCEVSASPVIYSHSCMRSMWEHERNITDEQALACAETGGVVGIAGGGNFLGENEATLEAMVRPIDHAVELLGPEHVGIGSDFSFDHLDAQAEFASHPDLFRRPTPGTAASTGCRPSTLAPSAPNCSGAAIRRRRSP